MQTRKQSLIEASLNIGSGFILSMCVYQLVMPMFGYPVTLVDNLGITSIFTVVSVVRSYVWRRIFNAKHRAVDHLLVRNG
jgi:hypothetical protein